MGDSNLLTKSTGRRRQEAFWRGLGIAIATIGYLGGLTLAAQNPPAQQKTSSPSSTAPASQKPVEQKKQETPPTQAPAKPGQLRLETPQVEQTKPETPEAAKPAQEARKDLIESIIFRGNRRIQASVLRARMFTHIGDVYDENSLERDFMALWNTGYLDDIRFEVSDGDKGKILTIFVREKKLVRSIDYKGMNTVQQSDVLDRYKERKVPLSIQSQYDPVVSNEQKWSCKSSW